MKKLFYTLMVLAMTALTFTSCDDVPMPYDQPNVPDTPSSEVIPTGTGTKDDPYNVAAALQAVKVLEGDATTDEIYVKGKVSEIKQIETAKYGNANYYITDDGSNKIYIFQSLYLGKQKFTSEDQLKVDDEVVVCGKFYNYSGNTPETVGKGSSYLYSLNGKTADTPDTPSETAKGSGTETDPYNAVAAVAKAKTLADGDKLENVYVSGTISKVGSFNSKYGELSYNISEDGTENGTQFYIYQGYGKDGAKFSSSDDLKVGQKVTVVGTLINFKGNTPEFQYGSKIVSIEGSGTTPTASDADLTINAADMGLTKGNVTEATLSNGIKLTFDANGGKSSPAYYDGSYASIRLYAMNKMTITAGKKIVKIVIETTDPQESKNYNGNDEAYAEDGTNKVSIVKNSNTEVTFAGLNSTNIDIVNAYSTNAGGTQLRIKTIKIYYAK
ncbi:MAG: hypothetical protein PUF37_03655 [Prevotellaceae bacterium]|nr:hypothetical protein [Prevotellaceae bacterium]